MCPNGFQMFRVSESPWALDKNTGDSVKAAVILDASWLSFYFWEVFSLESTTSRDSSIQTSLLLFQNYKGWKRKRLHSMEDTAKVPEPETDADKLLVVGGGV